MVLLADAKPSAVTGKPRSSTSKLASAASGAASGVAISAVLQPLDVLRTRLQVDATTGASQSWGRTLRSIIDGPSGGPSVLNLWRGTSATVVRVGGGAALHFYVLQSLRSLDDETVPLRSQPLKNALFGGLSRSAAVVLLCPITTIKTRMEASGAAAATYAYRSVPHALASVARSEGPLALWRGLAPALMTNVPFSAIHFAIYSALQQELGKQHRPGAAVNFASGALASVLATAATQPFDVLRTRAMLQLAAAPRASLGTLGSSLMAGVAPRLAKRTLQTAALWTLYEELAPRFERLLAPR